MTQVDDQINQVFSSIIHSSREVDLVSYEGDTFNLGTGPLRRDVETGELTVVLDHKENILGKGHPLVIKTLLLSSLEGLELAEENEIELLNKELEAFFSGFAPGLKCTLGTAEGKAAYNLGRSINFFEDNINQTLKASGPQYATNLFPVPLTLSTEAIAKTCSEVFISKSNLRLIRSQLKLFKLGNIYGAGGAIAKKQELLFPFFKKIDESTEVDGLIVKTEIDLSGKNLVGSPDGRLVFPLLFDELTLKAIGDIIGK